MWLILYASSPEHNSRAATLTACCDTNLLYKYLLSLPLPALDCMGTQSSLDHILRFYKRNEMVLSLIIFSPCWALQVANTTYHIAHKMSFIPHISWGILQCTTTPVRTAWSVDARCTVGKISIDYWAPLKSQCACIGHSIANIDWKFSTCPDLKVQ